MSHTRNGPRSKDVEKVAERYGSRGFDGSDDSTYYNASDVMALTENGPAVYYCTSFITVQRAHSEAKVLEAADVIRKQWGIREELGLNDCDYSVQPLDIYCGSLRIAALNYLEGRFIGQERA